MTDAQIKLKILELPMGQVLGAYASRSPGILTGTPSPCKNPKPLIGWWVYQGQ
jgi:hypothetical protein